MHEEAFWSDPRTWVAVAFVIFVVAVGPMIWRALAKLLDDRAASVKAELDEAARLRREAETMLRDAQGRREQAVADAKQMLENARAEAERLCRAAAEEAEAMARRREQMALDRIAAAEKAAVDEVRVSAAEIATAAAQEVLAQGLSPETDAHLVDRAIAGVPAALSARRAA